MYLPNPTARIFPSFNSLLQKTSSADTDLFGGRASKDLSAFSPDRPISSKRDVNLLSPVAAAEVSSATLALNLT